MKQDEYDFNMMAHDNKYCPYHSYSVTGQLFSDCNVHHIYRTPNIFIHSHVDLVGNLDEVVGITCSLTCNVNV